MTPTDLPTLRALDAANWRALTREWLGPELLGPDGALFVHQPEQEEPVTTPKPADYHARRQWQDEARARGEVPECGREACHNPASPAWVNKGTPLLYCSTCARLINGYNPGLCSREVT